MRAAWLAIVGRMKRRRTPILCIAVGSIFTLATAWIPPLVDPPIVAFPGLNLPPGQAAPWIGAPHTRWLGEPAWLATEGRSGIGVRRSFGCVEAADMAFSPSSGRWFFVVASGWPFYAFHGGGVQYPPAGSIDDPRAPPTLTLPAWVPSRQNHAPSIPIAPLWRGLAANMLFWSAAAFIVTSAVTTTLAATRRRAGRCVTCGYPSRGPGSDCPECGSRNTA